MTRSLTVVTVDDEPLALRRLELLLGVMDNVTLAGAAHSVDEAGRLIAELRPDAVLLDVDLDGETGFDLLERLPDNERPAIVFVTAFSQHATSAFDQEAVDYVLKPVDPQRLGAALQRVRRRLGLGDAGDRTDPVRSASGEQRDLREAAPPPETEFWIRMRGRDLVRVPVDAITAASSEDDYVRVFTGGRSWLMRETLVGLERRLPPGLFARVHRAHLARLSAIAELRRTPKGVEVWMRDGLVLPGGRVHLRVLRSRLIGGPPETDA